MKQAPTRCRRRARAGLTFVEVLLSIALLTMILGTATQVLYAMVHFWQESEEEPLFLRHVDGVTGFLSYAFDRSDDLSPARAHRHHGWRPPPESERPTFSFRLESGHPFFVTDIRPWPRVDAWLLFDEEAGLSLLWHVPIHLTENRLRLWRTPLSTWVKDVEIGYYDSERNIWEYESLIGDEVTAAREQPGSLRVLFEKEGREITRYVRLYRHDQHVLRY